MTAATAPTPKAGNIIPILQPPAYAPSAKNAIKAGEPVVVSLHDGAELPGALQLFLHKEKKIVLILDGKDAPTDIPFVKLKILAFPAPRKIPAGPPTEQHADSAKQAAGPQHYRIEFKDGNTLDGVSLGYRSDANGIYLYPLRDAAEFGYLFIPHSSIEQYRFGKAPQAPAADAQAPAEVSRGDAPEAPEIDGTSLNPREITTTDELEALLRAFKATPKLRLGEIMVKEGLITENDLAEALEMQKQYRTQGKNLQIGQVLMELQLINQTDVLRALSEKLGIPFIDIGKFKLNPESMKFVPEDLVKKYKLLPIHHYASKLVVALENPMDWEALDSVRFHSNLNIEPVMSTKEEVDRMIDVLYAAPDLEGTLFDDYMANEDDEDREEEYDESAVQDNVIVKLVNKIIIDAYQQGASDIHIEPYPGKHKTVVRIRKDGSLRNYYEVPGKMRNALIARIKIMADLDISEKRKPQDGKIDFKKFSMLKIELRVATIPTAADMEDVVMRILASGDPVPLEKLGLSERNADAVVSLVSKPYGLFFVCGPTGSGKTTTLHSILGYLNTPESKIWTAEDPVEITQRGLRQVQVNAKTGFTFAAAMRAFLRADPDIIMVGEMRDKETTSTGIEASLTGHMVFATLHTNSAPESIIRLLDMGMDPFNFADALVGILAQRLTKRLCANCKERYQASDEEIAELVAEYCFELIPKNAAPEHTAEVHRRVLEEWRTKFADEHGKFTLARAKGCPTCDQGGYKGRVGIHELLAASDRIKKKILEQAQVSEILEAALQDGMRTLKQDGIEKVLQGLTDIHTVRTVCIK